MGIIRISAQNAAAHPSPAGKMDHRDTFKLQSPGSKQRKGSILAEPTQAGGCGKHHHRMQFGCPAGIGLDLMMQNSDAPFALQAQAGGG